MQVEFATASHVGNTERIGHQPADCADSGDQGRVSLYEGVEAASKIEGPGHGGASPPELLATSPPVPGELPPLDRSVPPAAWTIRSFRVDVDWVRLSLSVAERRGGRRVMGLGADDFEVYEDAILQEIQSVQGADEPFHVLLLLDVSCSTASYLPILKTGPRPQSA